MKKLIFAISLFSIFVASCGEGTTTTEPTADTTAVATGDSTSTSDSASVEAAKDTTKK